VSDCGSISQDSEIRVQERSIQAEAVILSLKLVVSQVVVDANNGIFNVLLGSILIAEIDFLKSHFELLKGAFIGILNIVFGCFLEINSGSMLCCAQISNGLIDDINENVELVRSKYVEHILFIFKVFVGDAQLRMVLGHIFDELFLGLVDINEEVFVQFEGLNDLLSHDDHQMGEVIFVGDVTLGVFWDFSSSKHL